MQDVLDWLDGHMPTFKPLWATRLPCIGFDCPDADGLFVPRQVMLRVTPNLFWSGRVDPSEPIKMTIDSHPYGQTIEAIWFNNERRGGNRDETRLRGFDTASVLGDPESTGAMVMFAFEPATWGGQASCCVWMCETAAEEDRAEDRIGPADPDFGGALWPNIFERLDWPPRGDD